MFIVVTIDTEGWNHLWVTFKDAETLEWALATGVTSKIQLRQLGHSGCIAGWGLSGERTCGSHEGTLIVVAIDTEGWNHLWVTFKDAETLE